MRKTLSVAVLVLAFCCPAAAGIMHNPPPAPEPTPAPASAMQEPADDATLNGEIQTSGVSDILTETALELLAVLPALL
jgi:hypothetical protein